MKRFIIAAAVSLLAVGQLELQLSAVEVKLTVTDTANVARSAGTVTSGVPFAKGEVKDVSRLSASVGGKVVPAQFTLLAPWDDGSVRWALLDTQVDVPAGKSAEIVVRDDGRNVAPAAPVRVDASDAKVTVATGPMTLVVDRKAFNLLASATVDGKQLLSPAGRGLVLYTADGKEVVADAPTTVTVEHAGPMRAVVALRGRYPGVHDGLLGYTVRLYAYAGRKFVKVRVWLENDGRHGYAPEGKKIESEWFKFDGMAVELAPALGETITAASEGVKAAGRFRVYQHSVPVISNYHTSHGYKFMQYTIHSGDAPAPMELQLRYQNEKIDLTLPDEKKDPNRLASGDRTDGVVELTGDAGRLTVAIRHFWQNYEKSIELRDGKLNLWLWPREGQWPRKFTGHPSPGYAAKMMSTLRVDDLYNLPGSVHKGYELILDFGQSPEAASAELSQPLFALAAAEHYASTEAAPGLFTPPSVRTPDVECNMKLAAWNQMARNVADPASATSIWQSRKDRHEMGRAFSDGFAYGWMDFGDIAMPGHGTVSLHNDWPWVVCVSAMRFGDMDAMRLADEMMRHRLDVDQQWSDRAMPHIRGFQRQAGTYAQFHTTRFTRNHPNVQETWLAGVVLYHMLTGDAKAREAIDRTAPAMVAAWDRILKSDDYSTRRIPGDMQAVARTIFGYIALADLTGEKQWLDRADAMFNGPVASKWKSLGPHLHARDQIQSQSYTGDDVKYCHSIQAFCLLHRRTGNEKLLEMLKAGAEKDFPPNYFDAPLFLADLHAYVALQSGDEDLLEDAIEHWISTFPESKSPPVYLPGNSTWSSRVPMFLRTGHLLQYAHWKWKKKGE